VLYVTTLNGFIYLFQVLKGAVETNELREEEAARVAKDILFHTANRVYHLELEPQWPHS
jgi:hypothetical protein